MMHLEDSRIPPPPAGSVPSTQLTLLIVSLIDLLLDREGDVPIVRLRDSVKTLENVFPDSQIRAAGESGGNRVSLLRSQFSRTSCVLLPVLGNVGKFFGCDSLPNVLLQVLQNPAPTANSLVSANPVGNMPASCCTVIGGRVEKQILCRSEFDAALGVIAESGQNLVSILNSKLSNAPGVLGYPGYDFEFGCRDDRSYMLAQIQAYALPSAYTSDCRVAVLPQRLDGFRQFD